MPSGRRRTDATDVESFSLVILRVAAALMVPR